MEKVVHCIHGLTMGGAETLVKNYALALDKRKVDLTVLCLNRYDLPYEKILEKHGIKVIYISDYFSKFNFGKFINRVFHLLSRYYYFRKIIRELSPDVIHIHLPISRYVRFAHPKKDTKIIYTQHFIVQRLFENYPMEVKHIKWLIKNYSFRFIALNDDMKSSLNEFFNVDNTIVLNNGIDFASYEAMLDKKQKRKEIHLNENAFVIGHVGRLSEIKNHSFLLEIFSHYRKYNSNSCLLLVGTGESKDKIIKKAKELKILSYIKILENRDDVSELLKCMDIFVFPSKNEGLGIAVIEAQAAGLPCIVSDKVPLATKISNLIFYKSLAESPDKWAIDIDIISKKRIVPQYYNKEDWNINHIIKSLEEIYTE